MIYIKSPLQIEKISEAGKLSKKILLKALSSVKEGVTGVDINRLIEVELKKSGATSWFKEVNDYKYSSCISVNNDWLHGIPNDKPFMVGDIVSIDLGVKLNGFYVDNCWTVPVNNEFVEYDMFPISFSTSNSSLNDFLNVGVESLLSSINQAFVGNRLGAVSHEMNAVITRKGYSVIKEYAGHGVGLHPHEDPLIACYGSSGEGVSIKNGMVLAVEIMYSMGKSNIETGEDGWTIKAKDGSLTGMFEHTVAIINDKPVILTN